MRLTNFGNGTICWRQGRLAAPATPDTTDEAGNLTMHAFNQGSDAEAPCFLVTFVIGYSHGSVEPAPVDQMQLTIQVPAETADQSYSAIEEKAARQVPGTLRALADALERELASTAKERADRTD